MHVKGYSAPDTRAAAERARLLIEQAEALGEPLEDPGLLNLTLNGFYVANLMAFNGDVCRDNAARFLAFAEKKGATAPLRVGHRLMGSTLLLTGQFAESRAHFDRAFALYDPSKRATRDGAVMDFTWRAQAMWCLGYPETALRDAHRALKDAREFGQAATLMLALSWGTTTHLFCRNYEAASSGADELVALADEKGAVWWRATGMIHRGWLSSLTGKAADAVEMITSGLTALRSTDSTTFIPGYLSSLAKAYGDLGRFDDAWRSVDEAMTAVRTTKERWREADICHIAGEIALKSSEPDAAKAESHFERALAVARAQQAKSWELRAATSMARLWRDQGKRDDARELLAPVYGWFTEGFDTLDLKEAKALLDELSV